MNAIERQGIPFRPDRNALAAMAMRSLVRCAIAQSSRIFERGSNGYMPDPEIVLKRRGWGDDKLAAMLTRATGAPATTTVSGWAQELTQVADALLQSLVPMSAAAQVLAAGLSASFNGAATIRIPGLGVGTAKWVGEGQSIAAVTF